MKRNTDNLEGVHFEVLKNDDTGSPYKISLLDKNKEMPNKSGLNWGQRDNRDKNQAYLSIRVSEVGNEFIPPRGEYFTVFTDDNEQFFMTAVQGGRIINGKQYGKAFQTPKVGTQNNATLGLYFRERLGLESGQFVKKEHLIKYGRTDVSISKIDEDKFFLDFSI